MTDFDQRSNMNLRSCRRLAAALAVAAALPSTALAAHWPGLGGDPGRSGNQPVGAGAPPVQSLYSRTDATDQNVRTAPLATAGAVGVQRSAYGTAGGRVHVRVLDSGAAVGPAAGVDVDDGAADAGVLPPGLADTSTPSGLGQLLVAHNDDDESPTGDISIAQIDEASGALVKQVPLAGTAGFTIRSAPILTAPDAAGGRTLFFVAENGDDERLFRVPIADARSRSATFGAVTSTADVDADPQAGPTILWLRDAAGAAKQYVALGTGAPASAVVTFAVSDLAAGPKSGDLGDDVQSPTVPVQPDGSTPNPGGAVKTAPVLYAAARAGQATVVHRLVQNGNAQALATAASSPALGGLPAPALATDVTATPAGPTAGRVVVTTGQNLYLLDSAKLTPAGALSATALNPGTTGFGRTTAAVANGFAYVTTGDGDQLVVGLQDGRPVDAAAFAENPVNAAPRPASSAVGQPALSRSFVQFGGQKGIFVYVTRCGNPVSGTAGADKIIGTAAGADVRALGGNDRVSAAGADDCVAGGPGDDALSGNSGDDQVSGEDGADRIYGRAGSDSLSGLAGDDRMFGNGGTDTVRGGADDDRVVGGGGDDALSGNSGGDKVSGSGGNDKVFGRSGDDGVSGNGGNDRVSAGSGDDSAYGRAGDDGVSGNTGDDRVYGGSGTDRLFGRRGDDLIESRDGERDLVYCGTGRDTVRADRYDVVHRCERVFRR
jgi:Ca2+-binding RTX toxin-like protein